MSSRWRLGIEAFFLSFSVGLSGMHQLRDAGPEQRVVETNLESYENKKKPFQKFNRNFMQKNAKTNIFPSFNANQSDNWLTKDNYMITKIYLQHFSTIISPMPFLIQAASPPRRSAPSAAPHGTAADFRPGRTGSCLFVICGVFYDSKMAIFVKGTFLWQKI